MVVRAALQRREHGEVDLVLQVVHDLLPLLVFGAKALAVENEAGPDRKRTAVRNNSFSIQRVSKQAFENCPNASQREL